MNLQPDQAYISLRNSLIPEAEAFTNKLVGRSAIGKSDAERDKWNARWNQNFHSRMNRLYWWAVEEKEKQSCLAEEKATKDEKAWESLIGEKVNV
jgi:hypothetical protein